MAGNKKIFDLPLRTGVTADDRLAIVDSGNTTTYSVKLSDLQDGTGVNTLESLTGNITFSGTNIDISTNGQTIVLSGSTGGGGGGTSYFSATTENTSNIIQKDNGSSINFGDSSNYPGINNNFILGGTGHTIDAETYTNNAYNNNFIAGGDGHLIGTNNNNTTTDNAVMVGGYSHFIDRAGSNSAFVGGYNNQLNYGGSNFLGGGESNTIAQGNSAIVGGLNNFIGSSYSGIIAGESHYSRTTCGFIGGGYDHYINSYNLRGSAIVGGDVNYMNNTQKCFIGGGSNHDINGGGTITYDSAIIGGDLGFISGHSRSVILGGSGLTTSYDEEVLVPNLTIANYSSLNFSGDTAAAAGGVVLGQVYHDNGALRIRIT